jgi:hypothetical protein
MAGEGHAQALDLLLNYAAAPGAADLINRKVLCSGTPA